MSSLARCISLSSQVFYWTAHYVRHLSCVICIFSLSLSFSLSLPLYDLDLRVELCLLSVRFFFSFQHIRHTCRNLLKIGCRNSRNGFSFFRVCHGIKRLLMDFRFMTTLIFLLSHPSTPNVLMDLLLNFCCHLSFLDDPLSERSRRRCNRQSHLADSSA